MSVSGDLICCNICAMSHYTRTILYMYQSNFWFASISSTFWSLRVHLEVVLVLWCECWQLFTTQKKAFRTNVSSMYGNSFRLVYMPDKRRNNTQYGMPSPLPLLFLYSSYLDFTCGKQEMLSMVQRFIQGNTVCNFVPDNIYSRTGLDVLCWSWNKLLFLAHNRIVLPYL